MVTTDTSFILPSFNNWDSSALTFTIRDDDESFYSYALFGSPTYPAYINSGWDASQGLFALSKNASASLFDQQDIVRFLLASPSSLQAYTSDQTINQMLVDTVILSSVRRH